MTSGRKNLQKRRRHAAYLAFGQPSMLTALLMNRAVRTRVLVGAGRLGFCVNGLGGRCGLTMETLESGGPNRLPSEGLGQGWWVHTAHLRHRRCS